MTLRRAQLVLLAAAALWLAAVVAGSQGSAQGITRVLPGVDTSLPGAALYAFHCTPCHGPTGAGLDESRARFPADHQTCTRCHNPRNPPIMPEAAAPNSLAVFSLGEPTVLADAAYLAKFPTLAALEGYVQAAMPRWDPGKLTAAQAREVSLFMLHLSGSLPPDIAADFYAAEDLGFLEKLDAANVLLGH